MAGGALQTTVLGGKPVQRSPCSQLISRGGKGCIGRLVEGTVELRAVVSGKPPVIVRAVPVWQAWQLHGSGQRSFQTGNEH